MRNTIIYKACARAGGYLSIYSLIQKVTKKSKPLLVSLDLRTRRKQRKKKNNNKKEVDGESRPDFYFISSSHHM